ncbi:MAG: hypothetical protein JRI31_01730 [Deltaproteobacteria bacterium]|nr:hypothetical protein [Deltaproteobacteria bacterium]
MSDVRIGGLGGTAGVGAISFRDSRGGEVFHASRHPSSGSFDRVATGVALGFAIAPVVTPPALGVALLAGAGAYGAYKAGEYIYEHREEIREAASRAAHDVATAVKDGAETVKNAAIVAGEAIGRGAVTVGKGVASIVGTTVGLAAAKLFTFGRYLGSLVKGGFKLAGATLSVVGKAIDTVGSAIRHPVDFVKSVPERARSIKESLRVLCRGVKERVSRFLKSRKIRSTATEELPAMKYLGMKSLKHNIKTFTSTHEIKTLPNRNIEINSLNNNEKKMIKDFAALARMAYSGIREDRPFPKGYGKVSKGEIPEILRDFYNEERGLLVLPSGMKAVLAKSGNDVVISFAGTEPTPGKREGTIAADILQRMGLYSPMYKDAVATAKLIKDLVEKKGGSVRLTGHSLGGGLAQFAAATLGLEAVCYNSAALSASYLAHIGEERLEKAKDNIIHVRLDNDPVSITAGKSLSKGVEIGKIFTIQSSKTGLAAHKMASVQEALNTI